jgi:hypothetical protein
MKSPQVPIDVASQYLAETHHNRSSPLLHLKSMLNEAPLPRMKPASFAGTSRDQSLLRVCFSIAQSRPFAPVLSLP